MRLRATGRSSAENAATPKVRLELYIVQATSRPLSHYRENIVSKRPGLTTIEHHASHKGCLVAERIPKGAHSGGVTGGQLAEHLDVQRHEPPRVLKDEVNLVSGPVTPEVQPPARIECAPGLQRLKEGLAQRVSESTRLSASPGDLIPASQAARPQSAGLDSVKLPIFFGLSPDDPIGKDR